jgi:hypothetical protein
MVITPAFQVGDVSSILVTRTKTYGLACSKASAFLPCKERVVGSIPIRSTNCGYRIMVITGHCQCSDVSSILVTRTILRGDELILVFSAKINKYNMTIFKNKSNGKIYTIYKNSDGTLTAFPSGKVVEESSILKNCKLEDFFVHKIEQNIIKGFL